jgi:hypothetical protein
MRRRTVITIVIMGLVIVVLEVLLVSYAWRAAGADPSPPPQTMSEISHPCEDLWGLFGSDRPPLAEGFLTGLCDHTAASMRFTTFECAPLHFQHH